MAQMESRIQELEERLEVEERLESHFSCTHSLAHFELLVGTRIVEFWQGGVIYFDRNRYTVLCTCFTGIGRICSW